MEKLNDFLTVAQLIQARDGIWIQVFGLSTSVWLLPYITPLPYINQKKIILIVVIHIFEIKQKQKPFPPPEKPWNSNFRSLELTFLHSIYKCTFLYALELNASP